MFSAISVIRCGTHHREDVHLETRPPVLRLNRTERPELDVATRVVNEDAESAEAQGGRRRSAAPQPVQRKPAQRDSLGGIRGLRPEEPRRLRCHLPLRRRHLRIVAGTGRTQGRRQGLDPPQSGQQGELRGLGIPLTVTTDGAPGLIKAVEAIWPEAERIRCWAYRPLRGSAMPNGSWPSSSAAIPRP